MQIHFFPEQQRLHLDFKQGSETSNQLGGCRFYVWQQDLAALAARTRSDFVDHITPEIWFPNSSAIPSTSVCSVWWNEKPTHPIATEKNELKWSLSESLGQ